MKGRKSVVMRSCLGLELKWYTKQKIGDSKFLIPEKKRVPSKDEETTGHFQSNE